MLLTLLIYLRFWFATLVNNITTGAACKKKFVISHPCCMQEELKIKNMNHNKITPSFWFCTDKGKLSIVVAYYQNVFSNNFEAENIIPLGETPSGNTEMCGSTTLAI